MPYTFIPHTADVKIDVREKSVKEVFVTAALALREVIAGKMMVGEVYKHRINVSGKDLESLLYNFLEEFLFLYDAEDFILARVTDIKLDKDIFKLSAEVIGDKASGYKISNSVKAITYNDMFFQKEPDGTIKCQFVLDV